MRAKITNSELFNLYVREFAHCPIKHSYKEAAEILSKKYQTKITESGIITAIREHGKEFQPPVIKKPTSKHEWIKAYIEDFIHEYGLPANMYKIANEIVKFAEE